MIVFDLGDLKKSSMMRGKYAKAVCQDCSVTFTWLVLHILLSDVKHRHLYQLTKKYKFYFVNRGCQEDHELRWYSQCCPRLHGHCRHGCKVEQTHNGWVWIRWQSHTFFLYCIQKGTCTYRCIYKIPKSKDSKITFSLCVHLYRFKKSYRLWK